MFNLHWDVWIGSVIKLQWFSTEADVRSVTAITEPLLPPARPIWWTHNPNKFSRLHHWRNQIIHKEQEVYLLVGINESLTFLSPNILPNWNDWTRKVNLRIHHKPHISDSQMDFQDNGLVFFSEWQYMTLSWMWRKVVSAMIFWKYQVAVWLILRIVGVWESKNSKLTQTMPWYTFTQVPTVWLNEAFSFILKVCVTQSSMIATNRKTFQWNSLWIPTSQASYLIANL